MTIKKFFLAFLLVFLLATPALATDYYPCTARTGGGTGALDAIDGSDLETGDVALVTTSAATYIYRLDASSGAAESDPTVISPDDNAGTKRWLLVGGYLATIQLPTGTSANEISTDGTLADDSDDAIPTEKAVKTYVDGQIASVAAISNFAGYVGRPSFAYKDTDEIYINPGRYEHNGTSQQMLYWNSQLTFQFGPGGSNAGSSALAASDWFYLYIDDSAVSGAVQVASEFVAVTTEPSYSVTKHGWYNGNDRCIAAFLTNASSQILAFWHDGGGVLKYDAPVDNSPGSSISTSWTAQVLTMPSFSTKADVTFLLNNGADSWRYGYYRTTGSSGDGYILAYLKNSDSQTGTNTIDAITDSSQSIDLYASGSMTFSIYTNGYYFPRGM